MDRSEILEVVRNVYLFQDLTEEELEEVVTIATEEVYSSNQKIFDEGEEGDVFYVVVEGSVRISTEVPGVGEEALAVLKKGDYFGEMALIESAPRSAAAIANDDNTVLLAFKKAPFWSLMEKCPSVAFKVLWVFVKTLSRRLRDTDEKLKAILAMAKSF